MKYKIKLRNGRIIGPISIEQIDLLVKKGHINGEEKCQEYPNGTWKKIVDTPHLKEHILTGVLNKKANKSSVYSLIKKYREKKVGKTKKETHKLERPSFEPEPKTQVKNENTDKNKTISMSESEVIRLNTIEKKNKSDTKNSTPSVRPKKEKTKTAVTNNSNTDKTKLVRPQDQVDDKTKIVNPRNFIKTSTLKKTRIIEQQKDNKEDTQTKSEEIKTEEKEVTESSKSKESSKTIVTFDDETKIFHTDELVPYTPDYIENEYQDYLKVENDDGKSNKLNNKKLSNKSNTDEDDEVSQKKMKPIVVIAFLVVFYMLLFDEEAEDVKITPILPVIRMPLEREKIDEDKSYDFYKKGLVAYSKYKYTLKLEAADYFKKSLEYMRIDNDKSLGYLVLVYSELLPHVVKLTPKSRLGQKFDKFTLKRKFARNIFNLIKEGRIKSLSDINLVLGTSKFYEEFSRYNSAINVLLRFKNLKIYQNQINDLNIKFHTQMFNLLIKLDKLKPAKKYYESMLKISNKSIDLYLVMTEYLLKVNEFDQAESLLKEGAEKYKDSVKLWLKYAQILLDREKVEALPDILKVIKILKAENSGLYYSKYLVLNGMMAAFAGKSELATKYFKKALTIHESFDLRSKLAQSGQVQNKKINNLILDSKIYTLIRKSKEAQKKGDWTQTISYAIDAADLSENIEAKIYLAKLQAIRGYFNQSIRILEKLHKQYPFERRIDLELAQIYIDAYKFDAAENILENLSQTKEKFNPDYHLLKGILYLKSERYKQSNKSLRTTISLDPINDRPYYYLAKIYLKYRRFKQANESILKAIELDPSNSDYQILNSEILKLTKGEEAAIGYLATILIDNEDSEYINKESLSKIRGQMAIYYYQSGQLDDYEKMKKKLEENEESGLALLEAQIEAARLNDDKKNYIKYSKKLINKNPGDLNARMKFAQFLLSEGDLKKSLEELKEIEKRLDNYPTLHFYMSKIYLLQNDLEMAKKEAEKEAKLNKNLEYGYLVLGQIAMKEERYLDAISHYKKAQSLNFKSFDSLMGLALIKFKQGHAESALDLYQKAFKEEPNNPEVVKQLGYVYRALGQGTLAIESFKLYLNLNPDASDKNEIDTLVRELQ